MGQAHHVLGKAMPMHYWILYAMQEGGNCSVTLPAGTIHGACSCGTWCVQFKCNFGTWCMQFTIPCACRYHACCMQSQYVVHAVTISCAYSYNICCIAITIPGACSLDTWCMRYLSSSLTAAQSVALLELPLVGAGLKAACIAAAECMSPQCLFSTGG